MVTSRFAFIRGGLLATCVVAQSAVVHSEGAFDSQIKNNSLAVSPNESIAVVSYSDEPTVLVFDLNSGKVRSKLTGFVTPRNITFTPDGASIPYFRLRYGPDHALRQYLTQADRRHRCRARCFWHDDFGRRLQTLCQQSSGKHCHSVRSEGQHRRRRDHGLRPTTTRRAAQSRRKAALCHQFPR